MAHTLAYRLWQAPFADRKLAPLLAHNDLRRVRRVLDVGCGPGTNTSVFAHADYVGIDVNERYVEYARRRYGRTFVVADATTYSFTGERFDFILVNSFLHHLDDVSAQELLARLATLLTDDGHVHMLELVLPPEPSVARLLARADRGRFARPLDHWRRLFSEHLEPVVFEPYPLGAFGVTLWSMVYCKARARQR